MALVVRELGLCAYAEALALQEQIVANKLLGSADDSLLLVEHPPVYTLGRAADDADLLAAPTRLGVPVFRVGRGGGVTFHGPGQLVAYPILALPHAIRDVRRYVKFLEDILIAVCAEFGVSAAADGPHPGVWVAGAKLGAIGVGIKRWVTSHGVALNVSTDLDFFAAVVPCRVAGMRMTSLERECGRAIALADVRDVFVRRFTQAYAAISVRNEIGAPA